MLKIPRRELFSEVPVTPLCRAYRVHTAYGVPEKDLLYLKAKYPRPLCFRTPESQRSQRAGGSRTRSAAAGGSCSSCEPRSEPPARPSRGAPRRRAPAARSAPLRPAARALPAPPPLRFRLTRFARSSASGSASPARRGPRPGAARAVAEGARQRRSAGHWRGLGSEARPPPPAAGSGGRRSGRCRRARRPGPAGAPGHHGAALQPAPVRLAARRALPAGAGALLLRPRRAFRGQRGGQLQGGGVRPARPGRLRAAGLLRHAGARAAHGAQPGRSVSLAGGSAAGRSAARGLRARPGPAAPLAAGQPGAGACCGSGWPERRAGGWRRRG